jgi:hypothetical protein
VSAAAHNTDAARLTETRSTTSWSASTREGGMIGPATQEASPSKHGHALRGPANLGLLPWPRARILPPVRGLTRGWGPAKLPRTGSRPRTPRAPRDRSQVVDREGPDTGGRAGSFARCRVSVDVGQAGKRGYGGARDPPGLRRSCQPEPFEELVEPGPFGVHPYYPSSSATGGRQAVRRLLEQKPTIIDPTTGEVTVEIFVAVLAG